MPGKNHKSAQTALRSRQAAQERKRIRRYRKRLFVITGLERPYSGLSLELKEFLQQRGDPRASCIQPPYGPPPEKPLTAPRPLSSPQAYRIRLSALADAGVISIRPSQPPADAEPVNRAPPAALRPATPTDDSPPVFRASADAQRTAPPTPPRRHSTVTVSIPLLRLLQAGVALPDVRQRPLPRPPPRVIVSLPLTRLTWPPSTPESTLRPETWSPIKTPTRPLTPTLKYIHTARRALFM